MRVAKLVVLVVLSLALFGCGHGDPVLVRHEVPLGTVVAVGLVGMVTVLNLADGTSVRLGTIERVNSYLMMQKPVTYVYYQRGTEVMDQWIKGDGFAYSVEWLGR